MYTIVDVVVTANFSPMRARNTIGIATLIIAYALLLPGLTQPMLSVTGAIKNSGITKIGKEYVASNEHIPSILKGFVGDALEQINTDGEIQVYARQQSILGTITQLFDAGYVLVAALIGLFSVIVPLLKGLLLLAATVSTVGSAHWKFYHQSSGLISKWSMADVFVVALLVTFLAANAITDETLHFQSSFGSGFYYFFAYCVLSIASAQILSSGLGRSTQPNLE